MSIDQVLEQEATQYSEELQRIRLDHSKELHLIEEEESQRVVGRWIDLLCREVAADIFSNPPVLLSKVKNSPKVEARKQSEKTEKPKPKRKVAKAMEPVQHSIQVTSSHRRRRRRKGQSTESDERGTKPGQIQDVFEFFAI